MYTRTLLVVCLVAGAVVAQPPVAPPPLEVEPLPVPQPVAEPTPFTANPANAPVLIAPPKVDPPPLPPANVPTIPPARRLGDRTFLGPNPSHFLSAARDIVAANRDGSVIAFTHHQPALVVWDTAAAKVIRQHDDSIKSYSPYSRVELSPDGRTLYANRGQPGAHTPAVLRVWDVASGKALRERHTWLWALSADGKTLVTADWYHDPSDNEDRGLGLRPNCALAVWAAETGTLRRAFAYKGFFPGALIVAPDGSKVACTVGSKVMAFDAASGKVLWRTELVDEARHRNGEYRIAFAPDGKSLAACPVSIYPATRSVWLLDAATGAKRALVTLSDQYASNRPELIGLGFTPDGKTVFVGMKDGLVPVDVVSGSMPPERPSAPQRGKWQGRDEFFLRGIQPDDLNLLFGFALSGDGSKTVLGGFFEKDACGLRVIDTKTKAITYPPKMAPQLTPPFVLAPPFPEPFEAFEPRRGYPGWVKFPDGRWLRQGYAADQERLTMENYKRRTIRHFGRGQVTGFCVTPDAETVVTSGYLAGKDRFVYDSAVRFWDVETGQEWPGGVAFKPKALPSNRPMLRLSPDGRTLVGSQDDGSVWLWEVATMRPRLRLDPAGTDTIFMVAFSKDGRHLMSSDPTNQTGLVWNLAGAAGAKNDAAPGPRELARLWDDLKGEDAAWAYRAVWRLASHPAAVVRFFRGKARDVPAVTDAKRLAARPFDTDIVLARRVVEALELSASDDATALLRELAETATVRAPAAAAVRRMTKKE
ncbi:PQQ-binding-like beta-propeller repeat protein [bacterium]|nr:PQQ-binding-like beta-propeller repeat protein [bacterium]